MNNNILDNLSVLEEASERGVKLILKNGALSANSDTKIDHDLLLKIKENKAGIIEYLERFQGRDKVNKLPKVTSYEYNSSKKIPLSFSQERLWFTDKLQGSVAYHIPIIFQLKGDLNIIALEKSLRTIVDCHEILRTVIKSEEGEGYQETIPSNNWILPIIKLEGKKEIDNSISTFLKIPFDISKDYMLRAKLYDLGDKEFILAIIVHHIATDGWSQDLLISDFVNLYNTFESKNLVRKPTESSLKYSDYALWQREYIEDGVLDSQLNYWENKLKSGIPLDLPTDYVRPAIQNTEGATLKLDLTNSLSSSIDILCSQEGVTPFMFLLTAFKVLLFRYSGQDDICVGTPIANRTQAELEDIVGFFVNTLALRSNLNKNASFKETLQSVKKTTLESYDYQLAPFEKIVDRVVENRNMSMTPLFQVMFSLQDESKNENEEFVLKNLTLTPYEYKEDTSNFDLTLNIEKSQSRISLNMEYCSTLFNESTIEQMLNHYNELLKSIVDDINKDISSLSMLTNTEEEILTTNFNATDALYPKNKSIIDVFSEQVIKTPKETALVFNGSMMSYEVLDKESNKIANYLQSKNIKECAHIGLLFTRGFDMIASMIGILKAGCAYVPLDPSLPKNRLSFIIEDAGIDKIICKEENLHKSLIINKDIFINSDDLSVCKTSLPKKIKRNLDSTAYIMYTSGTTGTPKGILITDENILTLVYDKNAIQIKQTDNVLQWSNYAFDGSTYEIFGSLLSGATLHLVKNTSAANIVDLSQIIEKEKLTVMFVTTALFNSFVDYDLESLKGVRKLLFGGEKVSLNHVKKAYDYLGSDVLIHVYGPTETTTYATYHCVNSISEKSYTIPIGKPLSNTQTYVLNTNKDLVPIGVVGELYIGGTGVAKGYLNRENLTSDRFIVNRFKKQGNLYRTGDLVRWLKDGTIEFVGREDNQVKIRGYRIELGEIENILFKYKPVLNCCVLAKEDPKGNKRLVGYVVMENNFDQEAVQDFLKASLPDYMIPSIWVELDNIPLTSNGKINKKALPLPDMSNISTSEYVAPRNEKEQQIAEIWQELLGLEKIGIYDNFFELGGHSLLIVKLIAELQKYKLQAEVRDVFANPTISELSLKLEESKVNYVVPKNRIEEDCDYLTPEKLPLIDFNQSSLNTIMDAVPGGASNIQDIYPLAPLQEGIYFHYLMSGKENGDVYVLPSLLSFSSLEKREQFIEALSFVINRHDVLRTCILSDNIPHPVQIVLREVQLIPEKIILKGEQSISEELQEIVKQGKQRIDLSKAPLLQVKTIEDVEKGEYYVLLNQHHIIVDHVSLEKITEEILIYNEGNGNTLEKPALYRNFIGHTLHQQATNNSAEYFKDRFETIEEPTLPFGLHDIQGDGIEVIEANLALSKEFSEKILQTAHDLQMGPAAIFHAAYGLVVGICSHRYEQVVFGTVLSGRLQGVAGAERSLGLFINTLPLVCNLNTNVAEYLRQVQKELSGLLPYEQTSLTEIQGLSGVDRQLPLFSGILNYRHSEKDDNSELVNNDIEVLADKERTNYPFSLNVDDFGKGEEFTLTMQTDKKLNPKRVLSYVEKALEEIINNIPNEFIKVTDLNIVSAEEKETLLNVFNNTYQYYPTEITLVDLFESQVQKTPNAIASVFETEELTYKQLNQKSNQLANYLITKGTKPEDLIGISLDRSLNMLIGVLGIIKTGAAYVPIDPSLPTDRIDYIIEDAQIKLLITTENKVSIFDFNNQIKTILLDSHWSEIEKEATENLVGLCSPTQLAYVIYTSGSTGTPKGVMNEHRGVVNRLLWTQSQYKLTKDDIILQKTSFSFDVSVWELFWANQCGATLVFAKPEGHKDARYLKEIIETQKITTIHFVPSMLRVFLSEISLGDCSSLKRVICSGEALKLDDAILFKEKFKNVELENLYGPTEAAIDVTSWSVPLEEEIDKILIGKPVANTQLYILNNTVELLPIGAVGELCIGGVQVARGYLNNEKLTSDKFVDNPFKKGERLYKTGDLARWLPDGNIDFIGRLDDQVKIRGYRVELGEIESVLLQYNTIENCCVLAKKDSLGSDRLVGYAVGDNLDKQELQDFLRGTLPDYMVPLIWVFLDTMPLSNSGKIAKKALPNPEIGDLSTSEYVAPRNEKEQQIA
ncbi:non-ribosomal peptide synthetase, partial [Tenacibaculum ovolyticum]|uniref:non-ribosomal peptide synthetase n=1 Tax=Tenacibaculum ovolyticum TaxID=104270 RepID=UPI001F189F7D